MTKINNPTPPAEREAKVNQPRSSTNQVTEQLQSFCRLFINQFIREDFEDLSDIPFDSLDINVPRHAVKAVCYHQDNDSLIQSLIRLCIYGFFVRPLFSGYLLPDVWMQENLNFVPQVQLYFCDDPQSRAYKFKNNPLEGLCSFRLNKIDISTLSSANDIERMAERILNTFKNFKYSKGIYKYSYRDEENKLITWGFFASENEARSLFQNICYVVDIDYKDDYLFEHKPNSTFSTPDKISIFGRKYDIYRRRTGIVSFKKATLHIKGIKPVLLVKEERFQLKGDWHTELIQSFYV